MYLKPEEAILCLYLFPENVGFHLHSPMVFKVGEHCLGLRNDFECMMPDGWVGDRMDETVMRMKIVMRILMGAHNECREMIIAAANECWEQLHVDRDNAFNLKKQRMCSQGEVESL
ncbi:hypothetical protein TSUD_282660 [Trifolium subterraneum]|uniref:Uncharacterized protein n=1 Tax=Trifolium subterraneum TaxID=3900 RepID=A0A2Z6NY65_TRISU|nr:hypothetical protein TSUD_282660 [Trifolium subterraneum]